PSLFAGRDSRTVVIDSVIADLNYAVAHLNASADPTRSLITRDVAYAFLSRVALFEGTFRKYHTQYNLGGTVNELLNIAATAAKTVMENNVYGVHTGSGQDMSYRDLFISEAPVSREVI